MEAGVLEHFLAVGRSGVDDALDRQISDRRQRLPDSTPREKRTVFDDNLPDMFGLAEAGINCHGEHIFVGLGDPLQVQRMDRPAQRPEDRMAKIPQFGERRAGQRPISITCRPVCPDADKPDRPLAERYVTEEDGGDSPGRPRLRVMETSLFRTRPDADHMNLFSVRVFGSIRGKMRGYTDFRGG